MAGIIGYKYFGDNAEPIYGPAPAAPAQSIIGYHYFGDNAEPIYGPAPGNQSPAPAPPTPVTPPAPAPSTAPPSSVYPTPTPAPMPPAAPPPPPAAPAPSFTPWKVTPQQTVRQHAQEIIAQDSPLMQQARGAAMQQMNERGLINSSLGIQAAHDAVMGRALEIAKPDAATFARAGEFNAGQQNAWNLAQQELEIKRDQLAKDPENRMALLEAEAKYNTLMRNDEAFNKQYAMYVEALYQIDKDPNLTAEAKQAAKFQQARMLEDYAKLRGLNLNLDFSSRLAPAPAPAPSTGGIIGNTIGESPL